jgi:hypothetical protein
MLHHNLSPHQKLHTSTPEHIIRIHHFFENTHSDQKPLSSVTLKSQYGSVLQWQACMIPQKVQLQGSNSQMKAEVKKIIK